MRAVGRVFDYVLRFWMMPVAVVAIWVGDVRADVNVLAAVCQAANQAQAFDIGWDHWGVINSSTTQNRWVVCPLDYDGDKTVDSSVGF